MQHRSPELEQRSEQTNTRQKTVKEQTELMELAQVSGTRAILRVDQHQTKKIVRDQSELLSQLRCPRCSRRSQIYAQSRPALDKYSQRIVRTNGSVPLIQSKPTLQTTLGKRQSEISQSQWNVQNMKQTIPQSEQRSEQTNSGLID